jgi:hypothetical protein
LAPTPAQKQTPYEVQEVPAADIACVPSIGIARRDMLPMVKDPVSIEWMRALKTTLDPNGILNPWKML